MLNDFDKTWLYLDKLPKHKWILLSDLKLNDRAKFIELVKHCIDLHYQAYFNDDYTQIKILNKFPVFK